jgi:hypothetical protein
MKKWIKDWLFLGVNTVADEKEFIEFMVKEDRIKVLAIYDEKHDKEAAILEKIT